VWEQYFHNATIYALDIEPKFVEQLGQMDRVEASVVNVGNRVSLINWIAEANIDTLDIVIDDGSHRVYDIITAFSILWPRVTDGGCYIIEDAAQADDSWTLRYKFSELSDQALFNQNEILSVEFWPNMIVATKKMEDEPRAPKMGTL
jgi:hypothetical protein